MSVNLKSKLKPLLSLYRNFSQAPPIAVDSNNKTKFLVARHGRPVGRTCFEYSAISIDNTGHKVENNIKYPIPDRYHTPFASCNGLLLLLFSNSHDTKAHPGEALWNPTTNELKILPPSRATLDPRLLKLSSGYFGFGFDSASEDYKVIRFLRHKVWGPNQDSRIPLMPLEAELYSLSTNSWKSVIMGPDAYPGDGVHINGSCYWFNIAQPGYILSFNFASEKFASCPIPEPPSENLERNVSHLFKLVEYHGSLGAVVRWSTCLADPFYSFEVWVWDGGIWAWSLVSTFDIPIATGNAWTLVGNHKIIFLEEEKCDLMYFDFATGKLENIAGVNTDMVLEFIPLVESYVPLN